MAVMTSRLERYLAGFKAMIILIVMPWNHFPLAAQASWALPRCPDKCGNITVPFPFGMGPGCFLGEVYEMVCDEVSHPSKLTTKSLPAGYNQVLGISLADHTITISFPLAPPNASGVEYDLAFPRVMTDSSILSGLQSIYSSNISNISAPVTLNWEVKTIVDHTGGTTSGIKCIGDSTHWCSPAYHGFFTAYDARCNVGYEGNPYIDNGCEDINECEMPTVKRRCPSCQNVLGSYNCGPPDTNWMGIIVGISSGVGALVTFLFAWKLRKVIKKKRKRRLREKYFKRNGGLLLKQHLSSPVGNIEKGKLFNSKELEKPTDSFNDDRILGQGGQGTVYKGMLNGGRIVAIKKSKLVDEGNIENFINEVFILTNINHRNVVKLLGCCLETEVPILVYEYIPNGTLYQYIQSPNEEFQLTWEVRLQIAIEIAGALSYLHSAASIPIYHRDIKSTNILLDDRYRAKVADFGTSKLMALDQTHLTTEVHGTFGYLDPEYFQSGKFTDKSDVYSFGIVLIELLTGKKPTSSSESNEETYRGLAAYFINSLKVDQLFATVDDHVSSQARKEEIMAFANLARTCLNLSGKKRPTMKEVVLELESIRKLSQQYSKGHENQDDGGHECLESEDSENIDMASVTSFQSEMTINIVPSMEVTKPVLNTR